MQKKCHYCNFYSLPSNKHRETLVQSLMKEMEIRNKYLNETVNTIYFGGGTPSLLDAKEINDIIDVINKNYTVQEDAEITLEANPDDINNEKISEWKKTAINRISIGIQSFYDNDLKYLNRIHKELQGEESIRLLQDHGYHNLSIDLIYGAPSLGMGHWSNNLKKAVDLGVPHISAYALTLEPNTNLEVLINKGKLAPLSDSEAVNQFRFLVSYLKDKGFVHYEISNFCKPGFESKHNKAYWENIKYIGIGPSAHSYDNVSRQWNVSNTEKYVESIEKGIVPFECEILTKEQKFNEYVMTSLRTMDGLNLTHVEKEFGINHIQSILRQIEKYKNTDLINLTENCIYLTDEGKLFSDMICSELFVV